MDVIRHPHIGMNGEAKPFSRFDQGISKELVIRFNGKDRLTIIAALDDVLGVGRGWHSGEGEPWRDAFTHLLEAPPAPEMAIDTSDIGVDEAVQRILLKLEREGYLR
jgi:hypothetical protein